MYKASSLKSIKHGFFTRKGGVSSGDYDSLNIALTKGDKLENVLENRRIALSRLELNDFPLLTAKQVHGNNVILADKPWGHEQVAEHEADAIVTQNPDLVLGVITADCVPVLFYDQKQSIVGVAHAGWRGAIGGVVQETIKAFQSLGSNAEDIKAVIGPCIHQENYEVGPEVKQACETTVAGSSVFFSPTEKPDHTLFDLPGFVFHLLSNEGLNHIENINQDTYAQEDNFFSCRRAFHKGEKSFGCMLSAISLKRANEDISSSN